MPPPHRVLIQLQPHLHLHFQPPTSSPPSPPTCIHLCLLGLPAKLHRDLPRHADITTTTAITTPPSLPCHIPSLLSALAGCGLGSLGGVLGLVPRPRLPLFGSPPSSVLYSTWPLDPPTEDLNLFVVPPAPHTLLRQATTRAQCVCSAWMLEEGASKAELCSLLYISFSNCGRCCFFQIFLGFVS